MLIRFKDAFGKIVVYDVVETDKFNSVIEKLNTDFSITTGTLKFIFGGKKLDIEKTFEDNRLTDNCIVMVIVPKIPIASSSEQHNTKSDETMKEKESKCAIDIDLIMSIIPYALFMVHETPDLIHMFESSPTSVYDFMSNNEQVRHYIMEYMPIALANQINVKAGTFPATQLHVPLSYCDDQSSLKFPNGEKIEFTDMANINRILSMGFGITRDIAIQKYFNNEKSVDRVVNDILDGGGQH